VDVEDEMQELRCPLCEKDLYSDLGKGCKMCGMVPTEFDEEFCSKICEKNFKEINHGGK